jgi:dephospho-CoA kinase
MTGALRIGLTGGIASGKSRVMRRLAAAGCVVIDLDLVARELMEPGGVAFAEVVTAFGEDILAKDGRIDRPALAARVFADPAARKRLDAIVHPHVRDEEARRASQAAEAEVIVTEAALLVEAGMHLRFDRLVVVHCSPQTQMMRLQERDGVSEEDARRRLSAQMPIDEKRAFAHLELDTEGLLAATDARADDLARHLRELAQKRRSASVELDPGRAVRGLRRGPQPGPRGLGPIRLLAEMGRQGGVEMAALAAILEPPAAGPWYRAARASEAAPYPVHLSGPVAALSLLRAPGDEEYAAGLMASVARLTHASPDAIGNAVSFVQAVCASWASPSAPVGMPSAALRWTSRARYWARASYEDRVTPVLAEVAARSSAARLREVCARELGEASLAALLRDEGGEPGTDDPGHLQVAEALGRLARAVTGPGRG